MSGLSALQRGPVLAEHVQHRVHGRGAAGRFNTLVALWVTDKVGSMWCAYLFAAITLISLPAAIASRQPLIIVAWIAQTFLQLVLLPVIIVGQNVTQAHADARSETDHEILSTLHTLNQQQLEILHRLEAVEAEKGRSGHSRSHGHR